MIVKQYNDLVITENISEWISSSVEFKFGISNNVFSSNFRSNPKVEFCNFYKVRIYENTWMPSDGRYMDTIRWKIYIWYTRAKEQNKIN